MNIQELYRLKKLIDLSEQQTLLSDDLPQLKARYEALLDTTRKTFFVSLTDSQKARFDALQTPEDKTTMLKSLIDSEAELLLLEENEATKDILVQVRNGIQYLRFVIDPFAGIEEGVVVEEQLQSAVAPVSGKGPFVEEVEEFEDFFPTQELSGREVILDYFQKTLPALGDISFLTDDELSQCRVYIDQVENLSVGKIWDEIRVLLPRVKENMERMETQDKNKISSILMSFEKHRIERNPTEIAIRIIAEALLKYDEFYGEDLNQELISDKAIPLLFIKMEIKKILEARAQEEVTSSDLALSPSLPINPLETIIALTLPLHSDGSLGVGDGLDSSLYDFGDLLSQKDDEVGIIQKEISGVGIIIPDEKKTHLSTRDIKKRAESKGPFELFDGRVVTDPDKLAEVVIHQQEFVRDMLPDIEGYKNLSRLGREKLLKELKNCQEAQLVISKLVNEPDMKNQLLSDNPSYTRGSIDTDTLKDLYYSTLHEDDIIEFLFTHSPRYTRLEFISDGDMRDLYSLAQLVNPKVITNISDVWLHIKMQVKPYLRHHLQDMSTSDQQMLRKLFSCMDEDHNYKPPADTEKSSRDSEQSDGVHEMNFPSSLVQLSQGDDEDDGVDRKTNTPSPAIVCAVVALLIRYYYSPNFIKNKKSSSVVGKKGSHLKESQIFGMELDVKTAEAIGKHFLRRGVTSLARYQKTELTHNTREPLAKIISEYVNIIMAIRIAGKKSRDIFRPRLTNSTASSYELLEDKLNKLKLYNLRIQMQYVLTDNDYKKVSKIAQEVQIIIESFLNYSQDLQEVMSRSDVLIHRPKEREGDINGKRREDYANQELRLYFQVFDLSSVPPHITQNMVLPVELWTRILTSERPKLPVWPEKKSLIYIKNYLQASEKGRVRKKKQALQCLMVDGLTIAEGYKKLFIDQVFSILDTYI